MGLSPEWPLFANCAISAILANSFTPTNAGLKREK
jgi:hypothetical protein